MENKGTRIAKTVLKRKNKERDWSARFPDFIVTVIKTMW